MSRSILDEHHPAIRQSIAYTHAYVVREVQAARRIA
jgi:hypothetical protein